jgi:hypothetical protein
MTRSQIPWGLLFCFCVGASIIAWSPSALPSYYLEAQQREEEVLPESRTIRDADITISDDGWLFLNLREVADPPLLEEWWAEVSECLAPRETTLGDVRQLDFFMADLLLEIGELRGWAWAITDLDNLYIIYESGQTSEQFEQTIKHELTHYFNLDHPFDNGLISHCAGEKEEDDARFR